MSLPVPTGTRVLGSDILCRISLSHPSPSPLKVGSSLAVGRPVQTPGEFVSGGPFHPRWTPSPLWLGLRPFSNHRRRLTVFR